MRDSIEELDRRVNDLADIMGDILDTDDRAHNDLRNLSEDYSLALQVVEHRLGELVRTYEFYEKKDKRP